MLRLKLFSVVFISSFFLISCASSFNQKAENQNQKAPDWITQESLPEKVIKEEILSLDLPKRSDRSASTSTDEFDRTFHNPDEIPLEMNALVQKWVKYFTGKARARFGRMLSRGKDLIPMMQAMLRDEGIPEEMVYLALIESGFRTHARSHASAVGPWQFISGTGKRYGLEISHWVDERRDPRKATIAAAQYLKGLYNVFGSWYLAMAAYNAGENRIQRAVMKHHTRDFWELVKKKALPRETMNYVPKYIAARIIAKEPDRFGIRTKNVKYFRTNWVQLEVPSPLKLNFIAKETGVSLSELKAQNPELRRSVTPMNRKSYRLWLPVSGKKAFQKRSIAWKRQSVAFVKEQKRSSNGRYRVRYGDSWYELAKRFNTSVSHLKAINHKSRNRLYVGERIRVPGGKSRRAASYKSFSRNGAEYIRVKPGDTLSGISRKTNMTINSLRRWNGLRGNSIRIGQVLRVSPFKGRHPRTYTVRRGDNLIAISRRFNVPVRRIMRKNGLRRKDVLMAGTTLKL